MRIRMLVVAVLMTATAAGTALAAGGFGPWSAAVNLEQVPGTDPSVNTTSNDGCPISSPDGRELYVATNRPGGLGGIDIWVSTRDNAGAPWGPMLNLGEPVNSSADDFCPSPTGLGDLFLFVSCQGASNSAPVSGSEKCATCSGWGLPVRRGRGARGSGRRGRRRGRVRGGGSSCL